MFTKKEATLLLILIVILLAVAMALPENPIRVPCMDSWCLNGNEPLIP